VEGGVGGEGGGRGMVLNGSMSEGLRSLGSDFWCAYTKLFASPHVPLSLPSCVIWSLHPSAYSLSCTLTTRLSILYTLHPNHLNHTPHPKPAFSTQTFISTFTTSRVFGITYIRGAFHLSPAPHNMSSSSFTFHVPHSHSIYLHCTVIPSCCFF
jgi:hypothetical protein